MSDAPTEPTPAADDGGGSNTTRLVAIIAVVAVVLGGLIFALTRGGDDLDEIADVPTDEEDADAEGDDPQAEPDEADEEAEEEPADEPEDETEEPDEPEEPSDPDEGNGEIPADGPVITVTSFNFPESEILAEVYAQAMEDAGYPVERSLNLGARELIYPELLAGELDLLPEYLGSALVVWFEQDPPTDVAEGFATLTEQFAPEGFTVLSPAPAENTNAFVVTSDFAAETGASTIEDLAELGTLTFAGPPECEGRDTCYQGLVDRYGLSDISFDSIQEAAARLAALDAGDADMILLFSTDPPLAGDAYVLLEDTLGMVPPENITPVINGEVIDAYGDALRGLLDRITADITTDVLQEMNAAAAEGRSAADIAGAWLAGDL